jgi:hypothetical protein
MLAFLLLQTKGISQDVMIVGMLWFTGGLGSWITAFLEYLVSVREARLIYLLKFYQGRKQLWIHGICKFWRLLLFFRYDYDTYFLYKLGLCRHWWVWQCDCTSLSQLVFSISPLRYSGNQNERGTALDIHLSNHDRGLCIGVSLHGCHA